MSNLRDTDALLVNRNSSSAQVEKQNLMSNLRDDDLMLVNREGASYKITGKDLKDNLGPKGTVDTPSIIAPADGAGDLIAPEAAPDADGLTIQSSAFASTPVGSLGHTTSDWQITLKDDTTYASPVDEAADSTDRTQWRPSGLEDDTAYRCRVRHKSNNIVSEWSADSTFKTADLKNVAFTSKPSVWKHLNDNTAISDAKSLAQSDPLLSGVALAYGKATAVKVDGQTYNIESADNLPLSSIISTSKQIVSVGITWSSKGIALDSDKNLYWDDAEGMPNFTNPPKDTNVTTVVSNGTNNLGYIKEGELFTIGANTPIPGFDAYVNSVTPQAANVVFTDPDEYIIRAVPMNISNSISLCMALLTNKGRAYRIGKLRAAPFNNDVSTQSPVDITPPGVKFKTCAAGFTYGVDPWPAGCYFVTSSHLVYGFSTLDVSPTQPKVAYAEPLQIFSNLSSLNIISICSTASGTASRSTVYCSTDGIYANRKDQPFQKVSNDEYYEPADYLGPFTSNCRGGTKFAYPIGPQY